MLQVAQERRKAESSQTRTFELEQKEKLKNEIREEKNN
jgi:hypothetical protein